MKNACLNAFDIKMRKYFSCFCAILHNNTARVEVDAAGFYIHELIMNIALYFSCIFDCMNFHLWQLMVWR